MYQHYLLKLEIKLKQSFWGRQASDCTAQLQQSQQFDSDPSNTALESLFCILLLFIILFQNVINHFASILDKSDSCIFISIFTVNFKIMTWVTTDKQQKTSTYGGCTSKDPNTSCSHTFFFRHYLLFLKPLKHLQKKNADLAQCHIYCPPQGNLVIVDHDCLAWLAIRYVCTCAITLFTLFAFFSMTSSSLCIYSPNACEENQRVKNPIVLLCTKATITAFWPYRVGGREVSPLHEIKFAYF